MECQSCGGLVLWCGPLTNLTHTECQSCGAINNQVVEHDEQNEPTWDVLTVAEGAQS